MKGTTARRVAWTLWALLGVEATASLTLVAINHESVIGAVAGLILFLGMGTVGALATARRPDDSVGWLMLVSSVTFRFGGIASGLGHAALMVDSAPGGGTRVSGRVPAGAAVPLG